MNDWVFHPANPFSPSNPLNPMYSSSTNTVSDIDAIGGKEVFTAFVITALIFGLYMLKNMICDKIREDFKK